jgi:hypothetical protein
MTTPYRNFGPAVPEIARLVAHSIEPPDSLSFLQEVDRRFPGLSLRDYLAGRVLAAAWRLQTEGTA